MAATDLLAGVTAFLTVTTSLVVALGSAWRTIRQLRRELAEIHAAPALPSAAVVTGTFPAAVVDPMARPRILVVDDEPSFRRFLRRALDTEGYTADCVGTADEALALAHTYVYAVHIIDRTLHGSTMDGRELLRRLRRLRPRLVLYSGAITEEDRELAAREQFADALEEKGGDLDALLGVVRAQVDAWRAQVGAAPRA